MVLESAANHWDQPGLICGRAFQLKVTREFADSWNNVDEIDQIRDTLDSVGVELEPGEAGAVAGVRYLAKTFAEMVRAIVENSNLRSPETIREMDEGDAVTVHYSKGFIKTLAVQMTKFKEKGTPTNAT